MDGKLKKLIEGMIEEVALLDARSENRVDEIWDRNYDRIVDLVVEESCQERETCYEKEVHDMVADLRTMFYNGVEGYSFTCEGCGHTFYGKPFNSHGGEYCKRCRDSVED
ncbi:hypothetical protein PM10SUCC1_00080 [Propionigenium maris DSM 9537]|uniref:Uncharacterized protein n=1 Tax=Propionigenium maris DSM 9537 TaxID=1123000 RepID=A0A9W6GI21_9FUSO|nr:hypothetical protein [Propionigenium maris]GLI54493.1 hypothetical protein PM10SUCC1_00080 [Propionigenium maris DSM 9537]